MPVTVARKTPGVYITELDAFPPSIVGVQTAVPAFIGYTEKAEIHGKPVFLKPIKIGSLADYRAIFGGRFKSTYNIEEETDDTKIKNGDFDFKVTDKYYELTPTATSTFNLYNSMRLFYANGGGNCYVVSIGDYEKGKTIDKAHFEAGLHAIEEQTGPTMLVVPEAVLLPPKDPANPLESSDYESIVRQMLEQCHKLQDRVALLDVYGSLSATKQNLNDGTLPTAFRTAVGDKYLNYGMAYFPFLDTTVVPLSELDYTNVDAASTVPLKDLLTAENGRLFPPAGNTALQADIDQVDPAVASAAKPEDIAKVHQNLTAALPLMKVIERAMVKKESVLPPSPAMAGICTYVDATRGVWNAPANVALNSVDKPTFKVSHEQQGELNVPIDGKAIDVIREFPGQGSVVWGARTLDGNSNDYRYIQVRRTLIYIEQSVKLALKQFVFAANDGKTWVTVVSMISNFLQHLWSQGGLMGNSAAEAFTVDCGLGTTMTGQDILEGYMVVQITLQMIHPAEFIELTFKQRMEGVS